MSDKDYVHSSSDAWEEFFKRYYHADILCLANDYPNKRSLEIKFPTIENWNMELAQELLVTPDTGLAHMLEALKSYDLPINVSLEKAHIRIFDLPDQIDISSSLNEYIETFVSFQGFVQKASNRQIHAHTVAFRCLHCEHIQYIEQSEDRFIEPFECENDVCGRKGPFQEAPAETTRVDRQIIEVVTPPEERAGILVVRGLEVILEDDLAGTCRCGDRVIITGVLRVRRKTTNNMKSSQLYPYVSANSLIREIREYENLIITEKDITEIKQLARDPEIYNKLAASTAPSISGYSEIKTAIVLQLFGGINRKTEDGLLLRGSIHILLVGDPGVAKSQLLKYSVILSPRGIYIIGTGASAAGLTAAAVKDSFQEGRWTLEAGALVQADKGYIAVDEIEKLRKEDQAGLHEALEQQTVSIAKAGITATLNARCSCLAAANPKYGKFDRYRGLAEQIGLSPPLLSRFDLIFMILDEPDMKRDDIVASHILKTRQRVSPEHKSPISQDILRKYIAYAQREISPGVSDAAVQAIKTFYLDMRKRGTDPTSPVPITPRSLEAIIRLSEASARIRLSNEASIEDAERAIELMTASMNQAMTDPETGEFDDGMISGGASKSQRDRISTVLSIIKDLQKQNSGGASLSKIIEDAVKQRMTEEQVENILNRLKQDGSIIEGSRDYYRIV